MYSRKCCYINYAINFVFLWLYIIFFYYLKHIVHCFTNFKHICKWSFESIVFNSVAFFLFQLTPSHQLLNWMPWPWKGVNQPFTNRLNIAFHSTLPIHMLMITEVTTTRGKNYTKIYYNFFLCYLIFISLWHLMQTCLWSTLY